MGEGRKERAPPLPQTDLEWLSTARHHGVPTRLLDWTTRVEVAAFFAIQYCGTTSLDRPTLFAIRRLPDITTDDPFGIRTACCFETTVGSERISAQSSVFTVHPDPGTPFEPLSAAAWLFRMENAALLAMTKGSAPPRS